MASAESIFGAKTNVFIIKTTAIFAAIFLVTCLGLAILSSRKGKSLMAERALPPVSTQQAPPSAGQAVEPQEDPGNASGRARSCYATGTGYGRAGTGVRS